MTLNAAIMARRGEKGIRTCSSATGLGCVMRCDVQYLQVRQFLVMQDPGGASTLMEGLGADKNERGVEN